MNSLARAKLKKDDEFYTLYDDVEFELSHYKNEFENKIIYSPCDSSESAFVKYMLTNFKRLKLRKFIATCYGNPGKYLIRTENAFTEGELDGDGDFSSEEILVFKNQADIIITNPPFSKFREFYDFYKDKKFLILGLNIAWTYKNIFEDFKNDKIRLGYDRKDKDFVRPNKEIKKIKARWFTNLPVIFNKFIKLKKNCYADLFNINNKEYIDGYDILNINYISEIPNDYFKEMAVPVSFIDNYNKNQFKIIEKLKQPVIKGKRIFDRVIIKRVI